MTDVRQNTAFVVLGLLTGSTFSSAITICNNCGEDTDSSTASLGALLGILDPAGIEPRWLTPIGRRLVLNDAVVGLQHPATLDDLTDLVVSLRDRIGGTPPDPTRGARGLPQLPGLEVRRVWSNPFDSGVGWQGRDITGMRPPGSSAPSTGEGEVVELPGTWTRMEYEEFRDELLTLSYSATLTQPRDVRLMFSTTCEFRVWVDGAYAFGGPGYWVCPSPHQVPAGQFQDTRLDAGPHEIVVQVRRPEKIGTTAEWVIGLADRPSMEWLPGVFRRV